MLTALLATIALECLTAFFLGYRKKYQIFIIVLGNIITNPALNYILVVIRMLGFAISTGLILSLEAIVIITEWGIFNYSFKGDSKRHFVLSAVINTISYAVGTLIF